MNEAREGVGLPRLLASVRRQPSVARPQGRYVRAPSMTWEEEAAASGLCYLLSVSEPPCRALSSRRDATPPEKGRVAPRLLKSSKAT